MDARDAPLDGGHELLLGGGADHLAALAVHDRPAAFCQGLEAPWVDERRRELDDLRPRALECVAHAGIRLGGAELDAALRSGRALIATSRTARVDTAC